MRTLLLTLTVLITSPLFAQTPQNFSAIPKPELAGMSAQRLARIDKVVQDHVDRQTIPGAVALIIRNGKIVYHKAFGYSDLDKKTPLKKDDIFRLASQTKAITSLAVMMLFEEGKFLLDDPVSQYIPEFKNPKVLKVFNATDSSYTVEPANKEITIRHLLTHTSGIDYAVIGSDEFKAIYAKAEVPSGIGNDNYLLREKMKILATLPLKHHPGDRWTYGLNSDVLGYLIEIWSGMTFNDFLRQRVFDPLGMKDTYFFLPKEKQSRLVSLHRGEKGKVQKMISKPFDARDPDYPNLPGKYYSGGAGLSGTAEDYAKFLQVFLNGGEFNGVRLISRKTVELMLTDQIQLANAPDFGLGFGLETPANDHQSPASIGSFSWGGAFSTHYWADPKEKLIGIFYTNIYERPVNFSERFKILTYQAIVD